MKLGLLIITLLCACGDSGDSSSEEAFIILPEKRICEDGTPNRRFCYEAVDSKMNTHLVETINDYDFQWGSTETVLLNVMDVEPAPSNDANRTYAFVERLDSNPRLVGDRFTLNLLRGEASEPLNTRIQILGELFDCGGPLVCQLVFDDLPNQGEGFLTVEFEYRDGLVPVIVDTALTSP